MKNTSTQIIKTSISAKAKARAKCKKIVKRLPVPQYAIKWLAEAKTKEDFEDLANELALEFDLQMGQVAMDWLDSVGRSRTRGEEAVYARFLCEQMLEMMEELNWSGDKAEQKGRKQLRLSKSNALSPHAKSGTR